MLSEVVVRVARRIRTLRVPLDSASSGHLLRSEGVLLVPQIIALISWLLLPIIRQQVVNSVIIFQIGIELLVVAVGQLAHIILLL